MSSRNVNSRTFSKSRCTTLVALMIYPLLALAASPVGSSNDAATPAASVSPNGLAQSIATPTPQQPASSAGAPAVSTNSRQADWAARWRYYKTWARLNPLPLLLGGMVLVVLLVLLFAKRGNKLNEDPARRARSASENSTTSPVITSTSGTNEGNRSRESASSPGRSDTASGGEEEREVFEL